MNKERWSERGENRVSRRDPKRDKLRHIYTEGDIETFIHSKNKRRVIEREK